MASQGLKTHLWGWESFARASDRRKTDRSVPLSSVRAQLRSRTERDQMESRPNGTFHVEYLHEAVSDRWVLEPCPRQRASDMDLSTSSNVEKPAVNPASKSD
jgi:hypothetical protein